MRQTIKIEGMTCQHCVMAVKKELQKLDPQNLDVKIGAATVEYDETKINERSIKASIEEAGYKVIE